MVGYAAAMVLVWLSLAVFAAITLLASVTARSSIVAGGIGLGALVGAGILGAIPGLGSYLPTGLWGAAQQVALGTTPDPLIGPVAVDAADRRGRPRAGLVGLPPTGTLTRFHAGAAPCLSGPWLRSSSSSPRATR